MLMLRILGFSILGSDRCDRRCHCHDSDCEVNDDHSLVTQMHWLPAGIRRYRFAETGPGLRASSRVQLGHALQRIGQPVREASPHAERLVIQLQSSISAGVRCLLLRSDKQVPIREHAGEVRGFVILTVRGEDRTPLGRRAVANP
jgi:hypothetical protein